MLTSKIATQEEQRRHMDELRDWLRRERDTPSEGMADFFAKRLDIYEGVHLGRWAEEYAHIADFFDDGVGTLLDIGCGTGLELASMFRRFPELKVTGVDLSESMLAALSETYAGKDVELIEGDYFECALGTARYDAALSFETLHHFRREKKQAIYEKLLRAIRPGGCYIECDYIACCDEEESMCLEQYEYKRARDHVPDDVFVHLDLPLTLEHQRSLMERAGFGDVRVLYENCGTMIIRAQR